VFQLHKSLGIILPKDWTRGMNIVAGHEVELVYNGTVVIRAHPQSEEEGPHD